MTLFQAVHLFSLLARIAPKRERYRHGGSVKNLAVCALFCRFRRKIRTELLNIMRIQI